MTLLDSLLAFALTLAALATVVTLILEMLIRFLRMKTMDQITLITKLVDEARPDDSTRAGAGATNDEAVQHVLTNPFVKPWFRWLGGLFTTWRKAGTFYKEVSLEHTLRRLLESLESKNQGIAAAAADELQAKAEAWARKYDEYRSALAARFKARAQIGSLIVGVFLAFAMNINGLRIFEVYLQDPELRERVIAALQKEDNSTGDAETDGSEQQQSHSQETETDTEADKDTEKQMPGREEEQAENNAPGGSATAGGEPKTAKPATKPKDSGNKPAKEDTVPSEKEKALQKEIEELRAKFDQIDGLDLPIGWSYFPGCSTPNDAGSADLRCPPGKGHQFAVASSAFWVWLAQVLITGILIGLGAPFWYDVARRLAAVRGAFGGAKTAEARHRGADAAGDTEARETLIKRIVKDFTDPGPAPPAAPADGNGGGPKPQTT